MESLRGGREKKKGIGKDSESWETRAMESHRGWRERGSQLNVNLDLSESERIIALLLFLMSLSFYHQCVFFFLLISF